MSVVVALRQIQLVPCGVRGVVVARPCHVLALTVGVSPALRSTAMVLLTLSQLHHVYEEIKASATRSGGCSILVFVAPSCDALAACRILTVRAVVAGRVQQKCARGMA